MPALLTIFGGVAFIVYGVHVLKKGIKRWHGRGFESSLDQWSRRPFKAIVGGFVMALLAPSSTSLSMIAVQSVRSGQVTARQMMVVMLGADVGLTVLAQLLAFPIEQLAPALALAGVALHQYGKTPRKKGIGQILLSFSILFIGIGTIKSASSAFDPHGDLAHVLVIAERHQYGLAMLTAVLAMLLQSSTATIGLVIGLGGANGPLSGEMILPAVIGANIGVAAMTLAIGWGSLPSRRLAAMVLLSKLLVGWLVLVFTPWCLHIIAEEPAGLGRTVADAHTGFNLVKLIVVLPLVPLLHWLICMAIPEPRTSAQAAFGPRYLSRDTAHDPNPTVAMGQSLREILHVSDIVRSMLTDWWIGFKSSDAQLVKEVVARDDQIDLLDRDIHRYLSQVRSQDATDAPRQEQMRQLSYLCELEMVGDIIEKNLSRLAVKKIKAGIHFSKASWNELDDVFAKLTENMLIADTAFHTREPYVAGQLLQNKKVLSRIANELRDRHLGRQHHAQGESHQTAALYMDVIADLRRISNHVSHAAYPILQKTTIDSMSGSLPHGDGK